MARQNTVLRDALEKLFLDNKDAFDAKLAEMFLNPVEFKWLVGLKSQFELKAMPTKLDDESGLVGELINSFKVQREDAKRRAAV